MSQWSRIANVFRSDRPNHDIAGELESHILEANEQGRDAEDKREEPSAQRCAYAKRAAMPALRSSSKLSGRTQYSAGANSARTRRRPPLLPSLALAMGACIGAFHLIDAILLRPLPVDHPGRLCVPTLMPSLTYREWVGTRLVLNSAAGIFPRSRAH